MLTLVLGAPFALLFLIWLPYQVIKALLTDDVKPGQTYAGETEDYQVR